MNTQSPAESPPERCPPERHELSQAKTGSAAEKAPKVESPAFSSASQKKLTPEHLFSANQGLVGFCLSRFPFLSADEKEDAWGAGQVGLWGACQRFNPALGFSFSSYAARCIRGEILRGLRPGRRAARLPCVSLETPVGTKEQELCEMIADPHAEVPGQALVSAAGFHALLSLVPAKHRSVLRAVYEEDLAVSEVGQAQGVSRQRAHQIHTAALDALKQALEKKQARKGVIYSRKRAVSKQERALQERALVALSK